MHINPHLFMLARSPHLIIWDYKNHTQFELNLEYSTRLTQLIEDPEQFCSNNIIDSDLLNTHILITAEVDTIKWGWDELSKIFHTGTKNIPCEHTPYDIHEWSKQYLDHCNEVLATPSPTEMRAQYPTDDLIILPPPSSSPASSLVKSLFSRKTCRAFNEDAVSRSDVSTLLYLSLGHLKERECDSDDAIPEGLGARRSSPSGGGLNACEGFIYVRNVSQLKPGFYCYHSDRHALSLVNPLPEEPLGQLLCGQHFINNLPFGLFITSRFDALWWKYEHSRAYRMAYVEAGHISQTFQLIATALGLNTWLTGALTDDRVETLLGLHDSAEQPLFFVGCGHGDGQALCAELKALINRQETDDAHCDQ
ncbi:SagB family peptide dehydrogenase [Pseudomonas brassicacearum]|uniref:Dehydrogenase n=1 Tax=Pseudomonas brassicacearum TaxID=930166 RepID=A0A423GZ40_9PSED|nr:SagB family peptide dehydrogenase [Pseudomonas brassicacearum]RON03647.1 dehydrogenase [Pseudomonas brassicacearum]